LSPASGVSPPKPEWGWKGTDFYKRLDAQLNMSTYLESVTSNLYNNGHKRKLAEQTFNDIHRVISEVDQAIELPKTGEIDYFTEKTKNLLNSKDSRPAILVDEVSRFAKLTNSVGIRLADLLALPRENILAIKWIILPSGVGKTHIKGIRNDVLDVDQIYTDLARTGHSLEVRQLFASNTINATTAEIVRKKLPSYINKTTKYVLLHNSKELPLGVKPDLVASPALYTREDVKSLGEYAAYPPYLFALPQNDNSWHKVDTQISSRLEVLKIRGAVVLRTRSQLIGLLAKLGLKVTPFAPEVKIPTTVVSRNVTTTICLTRDVDLLLTQFLSTNQLPDYQDRVVITDSLAVVRLINALVILNIKGLSYSDKVVKECTRTIRHYESKVWGRHRYFNQIKLERLESGGFRTFNDETRLYLDSDFHKWEKYKDEHYDTILQQHYFTPDWLYKLKRYRLGVWDTRLGVTNDCWQIKRLYDPEMYEWFVDWATHTNWTRGVYMKVFKALTSMMVSFNRDISDKWMDWAHLNRFVLYNKNLDIEEYNTDLHDWLLSDKSARHVLNGSEQDWLTAFESAVEELLSENVNRQSMPVDQFINSPHLWAVSGSAKTAIKANKLNIGDKDYTVKKTKRAIAYGASFAELVEEWNSTDAECPVFNKFEPMRNRPVVNSPLGLYMRARHLDPLFDEMVNPKFAHCSPVFKSFNWEQDTQNQMKPNSWVNLPLDQKGFERQTSLKMLGCILNVMSRRLQPEDRHYVEELRYLINHSTLTYKDGGLNRLPIVNGLPSGIFFTAKWNTVINLAEFIMCAKQLNIEYDNLNGMGDDTRVRVKDYETAQQVLDFYSDSKIELNTKVAIVSKDVDEYLRFVTQLPPGEKDLNKPKSIYGYANRCIDSIVYKKMRGQEPVTLQQELESTLNNWNKLMSRSGVDLTTAMMTDIKFIAMGWKAPQNTDYINTPVYKGGFGQLPINSHRQISLEVKTGRVRFEQSSTTRLNQSLREIQISKQLPLQQMVPDEGFDASFVSETLGRTHLEYSVTEATLGNPFMPADVRQALYEFAKDLVTRINEFDELKYDKGSFIPTSDIQGSPFFRNLYKSLPDDLKIKLFDNPNTYLDLIRKVGPKLTEKIILNGLEWCSFKSTKFNVDWTNTIFSQFYCFWIMKYSKRVTIDALTTWCTTHFDAIMGAINHHVYG